MIQIFADGQLAYDSRLREPGKDYTILGLTTTTGENKGGTATIILPPGHPAYDMFVAHRTILEFFRDGTLRFRGRALYPTDDFLNRRTWLCEGELCLFQDSTVRPYLYQDTPAAIFTALVEDHNSQVEAYKQFRVGEITVTDDNDYVRLESESAEQTLTTINKLLERCGGKIVFSTAEDGARVVNWYAQTAFHSQQVIEFGANLLDFARSGANSDLATVIIPYGAVDAATGLRVDIKSVNNGLDYIRDEEAVALRGTISKSITWDDVTIPANLLRKAQLYLAEHRNIVTSLSLSAVDLSRMDKDIDDYQVGDSVRVRSRVHAVDDDFQLTDRTEDWLNPAQDRVTLGKSIRSLTDADVAGDDKSLSELQKTTIQIKSDQKGLASSLEETERVLSSQIKQTSDALASEVSNRQKDITGLKESVTSVKQTAEGLSVQVKNIQDNGTSKLTTGLGLTVDGTAVTISKVGSGMTNSLDETGMYVIRSKGTANEVVMLQANANGVVATDVSVRNYLIIGNHARFEDYNNGTDSKRTACFHTGGS